MLEVLMRDTRPAPRKTAPHPRSAIPGSSKNPRHDAVEELERAMGFEPTTPTLAKFGTAVKPLTLRAIAPPP